MWGYLLAGIVGIVVGGGIFYIWPKAEQIQLVNTFPTVPQISGTKLENSTCNDVQGVLFRSSWTTKSPVNKVMGWYSDELVKSGWKMDIVPEKNENIQYAEFTRGIFNSWLSKLQLSVHKDGNSGLTKIEISFPAPDSEKEEDE